MEHNPGFQVKVVTSDNYVKRDSGLIYLDIQVGKGDCPKDGQQVFPFIVLKHNFIMLINAVDQNESTATCSTNI